MRLDNGARGLAGDAGEVSSAVMKYIEYGRDLDRTNLIEEVGDCLWRLVQIAQAGGFTLEVAMESNIRKLSIRYPTKYSDELSANRDLAEEAKAIEQDGHGFGHVDEGEATNLFKGKLCEDCGEQATRAIHDSNRAFTREETHWFCTKHDRPTAILKD